MKDRLFSANRLWQILAVALLLAGSAGALPSNVLKEGQPVAAWPLDRYLEETMGVAFDGSSPYLVVELEGGTMALFRSEPEEPWGSQAEVAGYRLACKLGYPDLVPETVVRRLSRSDLPAGLWPYEESSRLGSLQRFLPARPATQEEVDAMPPDRRAALEILTFVIGRYDNHLGNTLIDDLGRIVIVDFENALEYQQTRYGDSPFVRKGRKNPDIAGPGGETPFPFEAVETLKNPTLEQVRARLKPFSAPWSPSPEGLHKMASNSRDGSLHSVVWDDHLWIMVRVSSRHPACTTHYPKALLDVLRSLTIGELREEILLPPFTEQHARLIMARRDLVLGAYTSTLRDGPPAVGPEI